MPAYGDGFFLSGKAVGAIAPRRFIAPTPATEGSFSQASGPRDLIVGVTGQVGPANGETFDYLIPGQVVALVEFGGPVKAGQPVTSDANGKAVVAGLGDRIGGYAHEDAVAGDLAGVILALAGDGGARRVKALPAFVAGASAPLAADVVDGAVFTIPSTAANSVVTIPNPAAPNEIPDGTQITFVADGALNGHTVTYADADGPATISAAATASKRHSAIATHAGGKWVMNLTVSP